MGRRGYPPEFRRKVLDVIDAGRKVADVAHDLGISDQTFYAWRRQDRNDRGLESGLTSAEKAELTAAKKRIAELEAELAVYRRATELLKKEVVPPKPATPRSRVAGLTLEEVAGARRSQRRPARWARGLPGGLQRHGPHGAWC
ncbi:transposase [Saccharopolyspora flava]|uniref:transposase n=2 Tax=Saccharopolyspora TaxID=1835 RepID=UPI000AD42880